MGKHGLLQRRVWKLAEHGDLQHGHDLAAFDAQNRGPQDLLRVDVDDNLHQATRLVDLQGAGDVIHRHLGDFDVFILLARLRFCEAHTPKLRIDEDGIGDETVLDTGVTVFDQVGAQNAEVVVGDVGERGWPLDIVERVDARDIGLQAVVGQNVAAFVYLDSGCGKVELFGIGRASRSDQEMRTGNDALFITALDRQCDMTIVCLAHALGGGLEENLDTILTQNLSNGLGYVLIFTSEQLGAALDDSDLAAEAAKHLPEFQTDVATAQDQQVLRHAIELHN